MPKGTNPRARVTMIVNSQAGKRLTEVDASRNTKVEDVKKMIADNIAKTEPKNNAITEPNAYAHCQDRDQERRWRRCKLLYGLQELQNMSTLAESRVRGRKVVLCLIMDSCESECDASGPLNFVDGSSSESDGPPNLVASRSSSERDGPPTLVVSGSSSESDD
jgi:hypothetical protein